MDSPAQKQYLHRMKKHSRIICISRFLLLFLFLSLWEISARTDMINAFIFSSPSRTLKSASLLFREGNLLSHIGITLLETLSSFLIVAIVSLFFASILWWNHNISEILDPYLVILNSLPKSAMAPIFIVWIGNNYKTIIITAVSVAIFGSILSLYSAFLHTDPDKIKLIYTLGGQKMHCFTKVVLPINLPSILSIFKVDIGLCLIGVVIGEFLAAKKGLGYLIIYSSQTFKMDWVILSILLLCFIAIGIYLLLGCLEQKLNKKYKNIS